MTWMVYHKRARFLSKGAKKAFWIIGVFFTFLPLIFHHAPLIMRFHGQYYFPAFCDYTEQDFSGTLLSEPEYAAAEFQSRLGPDDFCVWAPVRYSPEFIDETLSIAPSAPDMHHWLGTDCTGRDVFVMLLYALRQDVFVAILTVMLAAFLGGVVGCMQGYIGGTTDFALQRFFEVLGSMPEIILMLFLLEVNSCTLWSFVLWVGFLHSVHFSNVARVQVLRIRHFNYVLAARVMGLGGWHIFRHHVVPSTADLVYAKMPFQAASILGVLFAVTILRGTVTGIPSVGALIYQGRMYLCAPWILIPAVIFLMLFVMCLSFCASRLQVTLESGRDYE